MHIRTLTSDDAQIFQALRLRAVAQEPTTFAESQAQISAESPEQYATRLNDHGRGDFVLGALIGSEFVAMLGIYRLAHEKMAHKGIRSTLGVTLIPRLNAESAAPQ